MTNSRLALVYLLGFAGAIVVASYAGFRDFLPVLLEGTLVTIEITAMSAMVAVPCAVAAALAKIYGVLPLRWLAVAYIEIFRGTSALVQLFWLFFVLPHFGITLEPITAAVVGLGLNLGAYGAEVVRGAVQAVPRGQWEASTALNMTRAMALRRIVLPQAFVAMIPPWGNLFIELLKATSLVSLITITDLTFKAKGISDVTLRTAEVFNVALVIYLCIALVITYAMRTLERSATRGLARGRSA
ncbi:MAG: ectoine/hydroxyectoine ABC transporter permease subunit EhuC [Dongiaceae bacterium]